MVNCKKLFGGTLITTLKRERGGDEICVTNMDYPVYWYVIPNFCKSLGHDCRFYGAILVICSLFTYKTKITLELFGEQKKLFKSLIILPS